MEQKQYEILRGKVALNGETYLPGDIISIPEEEAERFPSGMLRAVEPVQVRDETPMPPPPPLKHKEGEDTERKYTPPQKKTEPPMKKTTGK